MNPLDIRIFLAIVEHQNISAAAKALHFTQPTVSEYLTNLEKKLGVQLVLRERGARKIMLTPAGEAFIPLARRWMELEEQTEQFVQSQKKQAFRIAASAAAHEYIVSHVIHKLIRKIPNIELRLLSLEMREVPEAIESHGFDAAFYFTTPPKSPLIRSVPLFGEERVILCPANTVLPNRVIAPEELDPAFEIFYAPHHRNKNIAAWRARFSRENTEPLFSVENLSAMHNYLTDPRSWALVPISVALLRISQTGDRLAFRYADPTPEGRECTLLISKAYPGENVIRALLACCDEYIDERTFLQKRLVLPENS